MRFVTYTTRFNKAWWLTVTGPRQDVTRAEVDATRSRGGETYTLTTKNVSRLELEASAGAFTIDGRTIKAGANPSFVKTGSAWTLAAPPSPRLRRDSADVREEAGLATNCARSTGCRVQ
mgnify:CR=1 FL=1